MISGMTGVSHPASATRSRKRRQSSTSKNGVDAVDGEQGIPAGEV